MRKNDLRKLRVYAATPMPIASAKAESAAWVIVPTNGPPPAPQMVRAKPRNETGGISATRSAVGTDSFGSRYGTVKLLASSASRTIAARKRTEMEIRRNAPAGRRDIKTPARAKTAKKLK